MNNIIRKSKNFKNNKKVLITIFIILAAIFISFIVIFNVINSHKVNKKIKTNDGRIILQNSLPDLSEIDPEISPVLYDFVNGSFGYKIDLTQNGQSDGTALETWGSFYALLKYHDEENDKNYLYISKYTYGDNLIRPTIGTKYIGYELSDSENKTINDFINNMTITRIYNENNYSLICVSEYMNNDSNQQFDCCDSSGRWCGIELSEYYINNGDSDFNTDYYSPMYNMVYTNGYGYPSEWLKKEPFKTIMYNSGYDMNDEFWSRYNVDSIKTYKKKDGKTDEKLKVTVDQLDRFYLKINDSPCYLNEEQLNNYLELEGWE